MLGDYEVRVFDPAQSMLANDAHASHFKLSRTPSLEAWLSLAWDEIRNPATGYLL